MRRLWRHAEAPLAAGGAALPAEPVRGNGAGSAAGRALRSPWVTYAASIGLGLIAAAVIVREAPRIVSAIRHALPHATASAPRRPPSIPGTLLYTTLGDDGAALYGVTAGSKPATAGPAAGYRITAIASADGAQLVTLRADCPRCVALYELRDVKTGATRVIGSAPSRPSDDALRPDAAFSADGRRVAFTEAGVDSPTPRIFVLDERSGTRVPLAPNDPQPQESPVWSPDGASVAYLAGGDLTVVELANVATGVARPLNDRLDHASDLAWSPDGRFLSLLHAGQLWLIDAKDGHGFQLPAPGNVVAIGGWSPGSRSLAVLSADEPASSAGPAPLLAIAVVPVEGGAPLILQTGVAKAAPRWSPDGRYVGWAWPMAGGWALWATPATGGSAMRLASGKGAVTLDSWR